MATHFTETWAIVVAWLVVLLAWLFAVGVCSFKFITNLWHRHKVRKMWRQRVMIARKPHGLWTPYGRSFEARQDERDQH